MVYTMLRRWWKVTGGDSILIMRWKCAEQVYNNELLLEWCGSYLPILLNGGKGNQCECMADWLAVEWRCGTQPCVGGGRVWGGESSQIMRWKCGEQEYNIEMKGASVGMDVGWLNGLYTTLKVLRDEWTTGIQKLMGDGLGDNGYT
ncbi:hypothetical protein T03_11046 [Trichinella britovi]|uniref:Uncharacterized protein n=1 Tax=Trichinella britovi TaxID=45882 RepID=A0A0V1DBR3_TRIBR|nr:hypothetical protein T03_11046 [Trichinella britovi]